MARYQIVAIPHCTPLVCAWCVEAGKEKSATVLVADQDDGARRWPACPGHARRMTRR
jgi:hypothetical protein